MGKHTATHRGRQVRIEKVDGTFLEGRFVTRTANGILVLTTGKVHKKYVRRLLLLRGGKSRPGE